MTSQEAKFLRFVTWNTNGIKGASGSSRKLSKVLEKLSEIQTDIAFIQETHIGPDDSSILEHVEGWNVFFTVHSPRSKGVAILIRDTVPFQYRCHDEDYSGGYFVLFCLLHGELYTLGNVYNHKKDRRVLGRLKDYLMETAQGMLVVGGDFNTVLHPNFDRIPVIDQMKQSPFRAILEDFISSLYLRDVWSYLHPTEPGFTRSQNESHSRIDMFFLPENTVGRVCDSKIESTEISDHKLLVLDVRVQQKSENKILNVASLLEEFQYNPDMRSGKINGAEIINAIKSLTDSEQRPGVLDAAFFKTNRCPLSEILKIEYNDILKTKVVPTYFKLPHCLRDQHLFAIEYLIFARTLANRLSEFLTPSFKQYKNGDILLGVEFGNRPQEIRWSFLKDILPTPDEPDHDPARDFSILEQILPGGSDRRSLQNGCPLTKPILNLALKKLESKFTNLCCTTSVCYQRQALNIYALPNAKLNEGQAREIIYKFREESGISLQC